MRKQLFTFLTALIISTSSLQASSPDIVFVGAGPIGLYTAIQAKIYAPQSDILILEQREGYTRKHTVALEQSSFLNSCQNREFRDLIATFTGHVRTTLIEEALKEKALELGIQINYETVSNYQTLESQFPDTNIFVGSDGSHSVIRKSFASDDQIAQQDLGHVVEVKYEAQGETRKLSTWTESASSLSLAYHYVTESIGKLNNEDHTPVTLRILVSPEEFAQLKKNKATAKTPLIFGTEHYSNSTPHKLHKSIKHWLDQRNRFTNEIAVPGSIKVSALNLQEYYSPQAFFTRENGKQIFLVGDAAFGVPYFRSINNGFESANVLSRVLATLIDPTCKFEMAANPKLSSSIASKSSFAMPQTNPEDYNNFMKSLQTREKITANFKGIGIKAGVTSLRKVQKVSHASSDVIDYSSKSSDKKNKVSGDCIIL